MFLMDEYLIYPFSVRPVSVEKGNPWAYSLLSGGRFFNLCERGLS